ncbi:MAG: hypothetical protein IAE79_00295 [Anaerolinea sp.]|nr:hypothetical protein [Anaerolinea sp.]
MNRDRQPSLDAPLLANMLQESLRHNQRPTLTISSDSMLPLLRRGDQVTLEPVAPAQLQPGDIITCLHNAHLLTHRYWDTAVSATQPHLHTRGDRSLQADAPTPTTDLIGRVTQRTRGKRTLSLQTGAGLWLNRALANLARREWQWLANAATPQPTWRVRALHRAVLLYGSLLTWLAAAWAKKGVQRET